MSEFAGVSYEQAREMTCEEIIEALPAATEDDVIRLMWEKAIRPVYELEPDVMNELIEWGMNHPLSVIAAAAQVWLDEHESIEETHVIPVGDGTYRQRWGRVTA
jgi:hypothetical protein